MGVAVDFSSLLPLCSSHRGLSLQVVSWEFGEGGEQMSWVVCCCVSVDGLLSVSGKKWVPLAVAACCCELWEILGVLGMPIGC